MPISVALWAMMPRVGPALGEPGAPLGVVPAGGSELAGRGGVEELADGRGGFEELPEGRGGALAGRGGTLLAGRGGALATALVANAGGTAEVGVEAAGAGGALAAAGWAAGFMSSSLPQPSSRSSALSLMRKRTLADPTVWPCAAS
jgi:hypothetical protein